MQNEAMKLQGKHAIVTGGSQGIGRGIIDAFIAQGATVVTCGRSPSPGNLPEGCWMSPTRRRLKLLPTHSNHQTFWSTTPVYRSKKTLPKAPTTTGSW
jgi:hypothetical protein